jgi:hypothetical protein
MQKDPLDVTLIWALVMVSVTVTLKLIGAI